MCVCTLYTYVFWSRGAIAGRTGVLLAGYQNHTHSKNVNPFCIEAPAEIYLSGVALCFSCPLIHENGLAIVHGIYCLKIHSSTLPIVDMQREF